MTRATHGTRSRYVAGCRCEKCNLANRDYQREYMRAWNARKRAAQDARASEQSAEEATDGR